MRGIHAILSALLIALLNLDEVASQTVNFTTFGRPQREMLQLYPSPYPVALAIDKQVNHHLLTVGDEVIMDLDKTFEVGAKYDVRQIFGCDSCVQKSLNGKSLTLAAKSLGYADFNVTATSLTGRYLGSDYFRIRVAGKNAYTFVTFPDTQNYDGWPRTYPDMTAWIAKNRDTQKINMVMHVGDVTNNNLLAQWTIVTVAYRNLDSAGIPYALLPGNHDLAGGIIGNNGANYDTKMDFYFSQQRFFANSEGAVYPGEPDHIQNNYKLITARDGTKWIIVSMEFGCRDDIILWADEILTKYSDRRAIFLSHHITNPADLAGPHSGPIYGEGQPKDGYGVNSNPEGANDALDLWDKLFSKHASVTFVFSGHVFGDGAETVVRYTDSGNPVVFLMVNYQDGVDQEMQTPGFPDVGGNGGNGGFRMLIMDPENNAVHIETYFARIDIPLIQARNGVRVPLRNDHIDGAYREADQTLEGMTVTAPPVQFRAITKNDFTVDLRVTSKITLDGSDTKDPLSQIKSAVWKNEYGVTVGVGLVAQVQALPGTVTYCLVVSDSLGRQSSEKVSVTGLDSTTLAFENFNDGNLDGWNIVQGAWFAAGPVNSGRHTPQGRLQHSISGGSGLILYGGSPLNDGYTIRALFNNENLTPAGVVVGGSNSTGQYYRLVFHCSAYSIRLEKVTSSGVVLLAEQKDMGLYDQPFMASLSLSKGVLVAIANGDILFGGEVRDSSGPALTGQAGFFHQGVFRLDVDNVVISSGTTYVDLGSPFLRLYDRDGNGYENLVYTPRTNGVIKSGRWTVDGAVVANNATTLNVYLQPGIHHVDVRFASAYDAATVEVIRKSDILLETSFDSNANGWRFVDEGELGTPASWIVSGGSLVQSSDRRSRMLQSSVAEESPTREWQLNWSPLGDGHHSLRKGAYAVWDSASAYQWTNYSVTVDYRSPSGGAVGILFRYQDANNYIKLELDVNGGTSQMIEMFQGIEQIYWQSQLPGYDKSGSNTVRVDIRGKRVSVWVDDGMSLFTPVIFANVKQGTIGLFTWGSPGTSFDRVEVVRL